MFKHAADENAVSSAKEPNSSRVDPAASASSSAGGASQASITEPRAAAQSPGEAQGSNEIPAANEQALTRVSFFDQSDGECFDEPNFDSEHQPPREYFSAPPPSKRRLIANTPAVNTDWTDRPLVTMKEFKRRSSIVQEATTRVMRQDRATEARARELIAQNQTTRTRYPTRYLTYWPQTLMYRTPRTS